MRTYLITPAPSKGIYSSPPKSSSNTPASPGTLTATEATGTAGKMRALRKVGVPYTDEDIAGAEEAVRGKTDLDALVAYLQGLGTASKNW